MAAEFESDYSNTTADHKMNSSNQFAAFEGHDDTDTSLNIVSDDDDSEVPEHHSRASSIYDDSGFNSSASEDRDDSVEHVMCDIQIKETDGKKDFHRDLPVCTELQAPCILQLDKSSTGKTNSNENSNSRFVSRRHISIGSDNVSDNDGSARNYARISRRQRTVSTNSQVTTVTPAIHRTPRNRRQRSRDMNNNEPGRISLNSYSRKSQFKLQDCFQDQGLLSLLACITYTLVLMFIFCVFGVLLDSVKSYIGTKALKHIRHDIAQSRRSRTAMASG